MLPSNPCARRYWMGKQVKVEMLRHSLSGRVGTVTNLNPDKEMILVKFDTPNNTSVSSWFKSGQISLKMSEDLKKSPRSGGKRK